MHINDVLRSVVGAPFQLLAIGRDRRKWQAQHRRLGKLEGFHEDSANEVQIVAPAGVVARVESLPAIERELALTDERRVFARERTRAASGGAYADPAGESIWPAARLQGPAGLAPCACAPYPSRTV